jgi:hypothetical protein
MTNYASKAVGASRLIRSRGQEMQLVYGATSGYGAGVADTPGGTTATPWGVVIEYTDRDLDGTQIKIGDKQVILEALSGMTEPQTKDALIIGGIEHAIVNVKPISPAGVVVIYELQVRRGA